MRSGRLYPFGDRTPGASFTEARWSLQSVWRFCWTNTFLFLNRESNPGSFSPHLRRIRYPAPACIFCTAVYYQLLLMVSPCNLTGFVSAAARSLGFITTDHTAQHASVSEKLPPLQGVMNKAHGLSRFLWLHQLCPPYVLLRTRGAFRKIFVCPLLRGRCKRNRLIFYTQSVPKFCFAETTWIHTFQRNSALFTPATGREVTVRGYRN
jgi:hypothetical protein